MFMYNLLLDESQSSEGQERKSVGLMTPACVQICIPTVFSSFPSYQVTIFFLYHLMLFAQNSFSNNSKCTVIYK